MKKERFKTCIKYQSLFLCVLGLMSVSTTMFAGTMTWDVSSEGMILLQADKSTVKSVFDYIEKHSKYVFVYDQSVKNRLNDKVSISFKASLPMS